MSAIDTALKPQQSGLTSTLNARLALGVVLAGLLLFAPTILSKYAIFQFTGVMAFAVAALGLNLITGYVGQVSLGHNAFFALGAYAAALSTIHLHVHYLISVLVAAAVCFAAGILAGFPAQRLRGLYLALITLVLAMSVAPFIKQFKEYTHGMAGLFVDRPTAPAWSGLSQDAWIYYVVLLFAALSFYLIRNFVSGSTGRALMGVREADLAASSMGVDINLHKVLVFGLGAMLAGIGGSLSTFTIGFIAPDSFTLMLSISFLAAIVVGGLGTIWGSLVAGLFLQFVPSYASDISQTLAGAVYGAILIICMFIMPQGIIGTLTRMLKERRGAAALSNDGSVAQNSKD
jgi:branched-chain amino acid transport system permease protein